MEDFIEVFFLSRTRDIESWKRIFGLLEEGESGVKFQNEMEQFGLEVDTRLEQILEERGAEQTFMVDSWECEENQFKAIFENPDYDFIDELKILLSLCPVTELKVSDMCN